MVTYRGLVAQPGVCVLLCSIKAGWCHLLLEYGSTTAVRRACLTPARGLVSGAPPHACRSMLAMLADGWSLEGGGK